MSGTRPTRTNASVKLALSEAMTMSHASAMEMPAPAATPLIAPMIGFSSRRIARMIGL